MDIVDSGLDGGMVLYCNEIESPRGGWMGRVGGKLPYVIEK